MAMAVMSIVPEATCETQADDDDDSDLPELQVTIETHPPCGRAGEIEPVFTISQEHRDEIQLVFNLFDSNGDGCISTSELGKRLHKMGIPFDQTEIEDAISGLDQTGDSMLTIEDFVDLCSRRMDDIESELTVQTAFDILDRNGCGFIPIAKMRHVLSELAPDATKQELDEMVAEMDIHGDGEIRFEEFRETLLPTEA